MEKLQTQRNFFMTMREKFRRNKDIAPATQATRYQLYAMDLHENDPSYHNATHAAHICDEALHIVRQRFALADKIRTTCAQLSELTCYLSLSIEEADKLRNMLDQLLSLTKDRSHLLHQLTGFDHSISHIQRLQEDALAAMPQIEEAEKNQKILRQDIGYLECEKADLESEQHVLEKCLYFISVFSIAMLCLLSFIVLYLGYQFMLHAYSIFYPTSVLILCTVVVITVVYFFRRRFRHALKQNMKKQRRAIHILNKKNIIYAHHTNFLNFVYKKYRVRNAGMLAKNLQNFETYKHTATRIDGIRKLMYETEYQLETFLREKNILYKQFSIEQFAQTLRVEDKIKYSQELAEAKEKLEQDLQALDKHHEDLWTQLETLQATDDSVENVIGKMMQLYFDEANRLFLNIDNKAQAE